MKRTRRDDKSAGYDIEGILKEMRDQYWQGIEEPPQNKQEDLSDYLLFAVGERSFAIPTTLAREVIRPPHLVRVPGAPEMIAGIFNLRGAIVAVTDLCAVLGLQRRTGIMEGRLVIVESEGITTALAVQKVVGIRAFAQAAIEPLPQGEAGLPREAVAGQVPWENELLIILDIGRLVENAELVVDQKTT